MRGNFQVRFCERLWCKQPYFLLSLDPATKRILNRGERLTQILKQDQFATMEITLQVLLLYAGSRGYLDELTLPQVDTFLDVAKNDVVGKYWSFMETLAATNDLDSETENKMIEYITDTADMIYHY
jgi:F-type H+-transporting ATPase subunit alpha